MYDHDMVVVFTVIAASILPWDKSLGDWQLI